MSMPSAIDCSELSASEIYNLHALHRDYLPMWVVYKDAVDFPDEIVARMFHTLPECRPTKFIIRRKTLKGIRDAIPDGLICIPRSIGDDPVIVESWL